MKKEETTYSTLHVDLDSLLDTRLSNLFLSKKISLNTKEEIYAYFNRTIDEFSMISFNEFKELYAKRSKIGLRLAVGTHINSLIKNFCASTLELPMVTPWYMKPRICVNIHPYKLVDEEIDVIINGLVHSLADLADIYVIDKTNLELTPSYIKDNFSIFVKYDLMEWLSNYDTKEAFDEVKLPDVSLIGPMLFYKDPRQDKEYIKYISEGGNPFLDVSRILKPLMNLVFLPVKHFSGVITGINDKATIDEEMKKYKESI